MSNQLLTFHDTPSKLHSFWKFSRPHTIIGTSLSVFALYLIAIATLSSPFTWDSLIPFLGALISCFFGNVYIVGLNQLKDVSIDKINKPHLPLAAGEFSYSQGKWIVVICGILALLISGLFGQWLLATVGISLAIGTAYSLPPIRLKRFPLLAAFCIFTVRGVIVNLGLFLYFTQQFSVEALIAPPVWALTAFVVIFTVAIAIFKDVPDMDGDKQYNITTFTLLLGKEAVFNLSRWVITIAYLGMIVASMIWLPTVNPWYMGITHLGLLLLLLWRSQNVDLSQKIEITEFYQFIWKLFFLEYLLFPMGCFLG